LCDRPDSPRSDGGPCGSTARLKTTRPAPNPRAAVDAPPAAAGRETPDRVAYVTEYRATIDAAYREYRAAREWDEAVPALRETWENHEKKWTYPERTGPAVHPEIPGAWRGDGGRYLAPDANAEVTRGCARIREVGETIITPAMRRIEAEDPGRHLAGLDYRLKGEDRIKEKVADELEARPGLTAAQSLSSVPDAVSTGVVSADRWNSRNDAFLAELRGRPMAALAESPNPRTWRTSGDRVDPWARRDSRNDRTAGAYPR
jgi:hypothetical protein